MVILAFGLLPSFRSVRLLNIIALCGTNYSCLYFFIYAAKHGIRPGAFTRCTAATPALVTCPKLSHLGIPSPNCDDDESNIKQDELRLIRAHIASM